MLVIGQEIGIWTYIYEVHSGSRRDRGGRRRSARPRWTFRRGIAGGAHDVDKCC